MIPIKQLPYGKYNTFRSSNRQIAERKYQKNHSDSRDRQALQRIWHVEPARQHGFLSILLLRLCAWHFQRVKIGDWQPQSLRDKPCPKQIYGCVSKLKPQQRVQGHLLYALFHENRPRKVAERTIHTSSGHVHDYIGGGILATFFTKY